MSGTHFYMQNFDNVASINSRGIIYLFIDLTWACLLLFHITTVAMTHVRPAVSWTKFIIWSARQWLAMSVTINFVIWVLASVPSHLAIMPSHIPQLNNCRSVSGPMICQFLDLWLVKWGWSLALSGYCWQLMQPSSRTKLLYELLQSMKKKLLANVFVFARIF